VAGSRRHEAMLAVDGVAFFREKMMWPCGRSETEESRVYIFFGDGRQEQRDDEGQK
jgi:hypothetical protein